MSNVGYDQSYRGATISGALRGALQTWDGLIEMLPVAVYVCDADGIVVQFNERATRLWGRTPELGDSCERFCGAYKLHLDGREIRHDETPMATVLRTGISIHDAEVVLERPDGSRIWPWSISIRSATKRAR